MFGTGETWGKEKSDASRRVTEGDRTCGKNPVIEGAIRLDAEIRKLESVVVRRAHGGHGGHGGGEGGEDVRKHRRTARSVRDVRDMAIEGMRRDSRRWTSWYVRRRERRVVSVASQRKSGLQRGNQQVR